MTYLQLGIAGFAQRRSQIVVTFLSLTVSFLLFGLLLAARQGFTAGASVPSSHRLRSQNASSAAQILPLSYAGRVKSIPGVKYVIYATATPAAFQDDPRHVLLQALPPEHFFDTFPELILAPQQRAAFETDKQSIIAGHEAVERYGWKLGQTIVLQTNVLNRDGGASWVFHLAGIYETDDPKIPRDLTFIRYDYLNDARVEDKDQILSLIETIADPSEAASISQALDSAFATSAPRLKTQPENESVQKELAQLGDFNSMVTIVASIVFFSMLLLSHNVWHERVRMRLGEFAVMRVLGFSRRFLFALVVSEAVTLTACGALAGTLLARFVAGLIKPHVDQLLAGFYFPSSAFATAAVISLLFGVASSVLPAWRAVSIEIIDALRTA